MDRVADAFIDVVLPVLLVGGLGYALGRARPIDLGPLTALAVYVLIPAIVFHFLATSTLSRPILIRLAGHVLLQLVLLGLITVAAARVLHLDRPSTSALLLGTLFTNSGNAGLPLAMVAFGQSGLELAVGWFAAHAIAASSLGAYLAARGRGGGREALRRLSRFPVTYAVVAGVTANLSGLSLPGPITKATQLLASGGIAVMLLLVGLQLARVNPRAEFGTASLASGVRLVVAPVLAWVTAPLLGLDGIARSVSILQASLPTAVTSAMWAMEFDSRPELVASTVVISTLASPLTITALLALFL